MLIIGPGQLDCQTDTVKTGKLYLVAMYDPRYRFAAPLEGHGNATMDMAEIRAEIRSIEWR